MRCPCCGKLFIRSTDGTLIDLDELKKPAKVKTETEILLEVVQDFSDWIKQTSVGSIKYEK